MSKINWKHAASVILINKSLKHILMMKRGPTAKFMPNSMVFPGGLLEKPADSNFDKSLSNFSPAKDANMDVDVDLGFRICALRELFEEAGILLRENEVITSGEDKSLDEWRDKITKDPSLFSQLFTTKNPADVSVLKPFARWLTPNAYKRRFDTVFYTAQLESFNEEVYHCEKEMVQSMWITPRQCLEETAEKKTISLAPPQFLAMLALVQQDLTVPIETTVYPERMCPQIIECKEEPTLRCGLHYPDSDYITEDSDFVGLRYMNKDQIQNPKGDKVMRIVYNMVDSMYTGQSVIYKV
ncbi:unnamed protein product [Bursaphelenchus okinawaensis]|uniref:Nudix hydrolase domain-containing protein n=1 Tax=Bursaphelenchus okinawaensis TaxID=465554 RepID=A0A811KCS1_9BILA|nr:unnamed protein product [Bursaphelenchus okinawaensis]CAG9098738.1 unnamed protein product [Bursaphelenchus okinawaensis]